MLVLGFRPVPENFFLFSLRAIRLAAFVATITLAAVHFGPGREAKARSCLDDTVQSKSDDGSILVMMSGAVYEVLPGDNIDSALWLAPQDVPICEAPIVYQGRTVMIYDVINTDEGEKVGAHRLR
jgi:hypothetical protein